MGAVHPRFPPRSVQLELELTFPGGARRAAVLGSMRLDPELSDPLPIEPPTEEPRIVICMATFNPDPGLIERQLRSIADQSVRSWRCIIADDNSQPAAQERIRRLAGTDDRFLVAPRHGGRLGVYGNFERLLSLVPDWAQAVALSDQDDNWYPGKLAALWERLRVGDTTLAYSDMRIVSEAGIALAPTYWTTRRNNHTDLASMLVANTVTGAASLFSPELIANLLPFPPKIDGAMHDWWIGTTALALGSVAYIDEPLYDYVQHRGNVLGHLAPPVPRLSAEDVRVLLSASVPRRPEAAEVVERARCDYFDHVQRVVLHAKTLELRCAGRWSSPERHDDAFRIARMDSSGRDLAWMLGRGLLRWGRPSVTIARSSCSRAGSPGGFGPSAPRSRKSVGKYISTTPSSGASPVVGAASRGGVRPSARRSLPVAPDRDPERRAHGNIRGSDRRAFSWSGDRMPHATRSSGWSGGKSPAVRAISSHVNGRILIATQDGAVTIEVVGLSKIFRVPREPQHATI